MSEDGLHEIILRLRPLMGIGHSHPVAYRGPLTRAAVRPPGRSTRAGAGDRRRGAGARRAPGGTSRCRRGRSRTAYFRNGKAQTSAALNPWPDRKSPSVSRCSKTSMRARIRSACSAMRSASGSGRSSSSAIALGETFQTSLNHVMNTSTRAREMRSAGYRRRFGSDLLEALDDGHRVGDDLAVELGDRDEVLPAELADRRAVVGVVVDPRDRHGLVARGERDALDVRGEGDAVDAQHGRHRLAERAHRRKGSCTRAASCAYPPAPGWAPSPAPASASHGPSRRRSSTTGTYGTRRDGARLGEALRAAPRSARCGPGRRPAAARPRARAAPAPLRGRGPRRARARRRRAGPAPGRPRPLRRWRRRRTRRGSPRRARSAAAPRRPTWRRPPPTARAARRGCRPSAGCPRPTTPRPRVRPSRARPDHPRRRRRSRRRTGRGDRAGGQRSGRSG